MSTKLAKQTQKTAGISNGMRTATITDVSDSAITISVAGGEFTSGVGVLTSYVPIVGDEVAVFRQDSSWLILGPTAAATGWNLLADLGYENGWFDASGGFALGQWRRTATEVQMVGEIRNTPAVSALQVVGGGLPAPPAQAVMLATWNGTNTVRFVVGNLGQLTIYNMPTGALGTVQFCCSYPLDFRTV